MTEDWLARWEQGRTGWHEADGNEGLKSFWPALAEGSRVLVPLCGKSPDLRWLAERGLDVTGIELSEIAARDFFAEQELEFRKKRIDAFDCYQAKELPLAIYVGDYFGFPASSKGFDGLYDRGALVAMPVELRADYVSHTQALLAEGAVRMVITLEYDQSICAGPPFAVMPDELRAYWPDLERVHVRDDRETCPPKFIAAGIKDINEVVWLSSSARR